MVECLLSAASLHRLTSFLFNRCINAVCLILNLVSSICFLPKLSFYPLHYIMSYFVNFIVYYVIFYRGTYKIEYVTYTGLILRSRSISFFVILLVYLK